MRRVTGLMVFAALVASAACSSQQTPTAPSTEALSRGAAAASDGASTPSVDGTPARPLPLLSNAELIRSAARSDQLAVCHRTGNGGYRLIHIDEKRWNVHQRHGDASPGQSVPGMPGYEFDEACDPQPEQPAGCEPVTGTWQGTYSWDCGFPGGTGTVDIYLELTDQCSGDITGTVAYMGGTSAVTGWRYSDATYDEWGITGGTVDPDGQDLSLRWDASDGNFVNQQFSGVVGGGGDVVSGITLNGDTVIAGSNGCSHPDGLPGSGTFEIRRIGS